MSLQDLEWQEVTIKEEGFHTLLIAGVTARAHYVYVYIICKYISFHTLLIAGVTAREIVDLLEEDHYCFHTLLIAGVTARVHLLRIKSFLSASARSDFVRHCGCLPPHQGYKKTPANRPLGIENGGHDGRLWIENCGCLHRRRGFITTPANRLHGFENGGQSSYRLTENCGCLQRCG